MNVMAMDPRTVAVHEAGHAVMQWFVGWESELQFIQMRRVQGGVDEGFMKIPAPDRSLYRDERIARRKLLVLLAGAATTDDPASQHNSGDFMEACMVLGGLFQCRITWKPGIGIAVVEEKPNSLLQTAVETCKAIVSDPSIRCGIEAVAQMLAAAQSDSNGVCRVERGQIIELCHRECEPIRTTNSWLGWLNPA